jgi:hypothetical protein
MRVHDHAYKFTFPWKSFTAQVIAVGGYSGDRFAGHLRIRKERIAHSEPRGMQARGDRVSGEASSGGGAVLDDMTIPCDEVCYRHAYEGSCSPLCPLSGDGG